MEDFIKRERQYNLAYKGQDRSEGYSIKVNDLGLFFWNELKDFVNSRIEDWNTEPNNYNCSLWDFIINQINCNSMAWGDSFDYCVACLGEEKVKELVKDMKEKN